MDEALVRKLIPLILPVVLLELALLAAALWDLAHRDKVRGGKKWVWVLVSLVNIVGPLAYFLFGREE
jgi:hypothetical protein